MSLPVIVFPAGSLPDAGAIDVILPW